MSAEIVTPSNRGSKGSPAPAQPVLIEKLLPVLCILCGPNVNGNVLVDGAGSLTVPVTLPSRLNVILTLISGPYWNVGEALSTRVGPSKSLTSELLVNASLLLNT